MPEQTCGCAARKALEYCQSILPAEGEPETGVLGPAAFRPRWYAIQRAVVEALAAPCPCSALRERADTAEALAMVREYEADRANEDYGKAIQLLHSLRAELATANEKIKSLERRLAAAELGWA